jgi:hypothetical protein
MHFSMFAFWKAQKGWRPTTTHHYTSLSTTPLIDSLHFINDSTNDWMLEAKLEQEKWRNHIEKSLYLQSSPKYILLQIRSTQT